MRLLIFLLPLALAAPSDLTKRNTLGFLENIFNQGELSLIVNTLSKSLGTNETEQACEEECHILIKQNHLLQHACPLVCHSLQELVHQLAPASRRSIFTDAYQKLLGMFDIEHLKQVVHQMFSKLGSDPTEALCETTCHAVITMDHLLQHGCPLVCHSFQELVSHFHLGSTDAPVVKRSYGTAENKRFLLDSVNLGNFLNAEELKVLVTGLVNTVGSDATEAACETECRVLIKTDHVLQYVCPLVCHSLQEIAHQLAPASRRSIFTDTFQKLLGMFDLEHLKQVVHQMFSKLGSDPTEALCETTCHAVITMDHLLQHGCPLVCHSFQELVHHFDIGNTQGSSTPISLRSKPFAS